MSGEQSQDMTKAAGDAVRQEDPAMTAPAVEERPRPDAVPLVTAGAEESSGSEDAAGQEEYAAIRAATLAMSGAPDVVDEKQLDELAIAICLPQDGEQTPEA